MIFEALELERRGKRERKKERKKGWEGEGGGDSRTKNAPETNSDPYA